MDNAVAEVSAGAFCDHRLAPFLVFESTGYVSEVGRALLLTKFPTARMIDPFGCSPFGRGQRPYFQKMADKQNHKGTLETVSSQPW